MVMAVQAQSGRYLTLVISCLGLFMVLLDASIVTVALPTIQRSLQTNLADLQWVVDAYTLPFAVLLLTAGTLADRFGRKRLFLAGLAIFVAGSAICGGAPTYSWLVIGRIIQGVGGAMLSPGSLAVLVAAFPEPQERTRILGISTGISGVALAAGPIIGGTLIQLASWQWIFFVNLPVGLITLALGIPGLRESRNPQARNLDIPGQILAILALSALTYGLIEGNTLGWASPEILGCFGAALLLGIGFIFVEARATEPMLPLSLFRRPAFSVANLAAIAVGFALLGGVFFIAQYFQAIQGYSPLGSGLRSLPNTIGIFIASPLAGVLAARFGPRLPVVIGGIMSGSAALLLMRLAPDTAYPAIWWNLALLGLGFGLTLTPLTAAVLATTPSNRAGLASSLVNASRQIGSVLGVTVLGAIVQNRYADGLTAVLTQHNVHSNSSQTLADQIAAAGSQAALVLARLHLRLAPIELHTAFVNALHPAFAAAGLLLLMMAMFTAIFMHLPAPQAAPARANEIPIAPAMVE